MNNHLRTCFLVTMLAQVILPQQAQAQLSTDGTIATATAVSAIVTAATVVGIRALWKQYQRKQFEPSSIGSMQPRTRDITLSFLLKTELSKGVRSKLRNASITEILKPLDSETIVSKALATVQDRLPQDARTQKAFEQFRLSLKTPAKNGKTIAENLFETTMQTVRPQMLAERISVNPASWAVTTNTLLKGNVVKKLKETGSQLEKELSQTTDIQRSELLDGIKAHQALEVQLKALQDPRYENWASTFKNLKKLLEKSPSMKEVLTKIVANLMVTHLDNPEFKKSIESPTIQNLTSKEVHTFVNTQESYPREPEMTNAQPQREEPYSPKSESGISEATTEIMEI